MTDRIFNCIIRNLPSISFGFFLLICRPFPGLKHLVRRGVPFPYVKGVSCGVPTPLIDAGVDFLLEVFNKNKKS